MSGKDNQQPEDTNSGETKMPKKPMDDYFEFQRDEGKGLVKGAKCQIRGSGGGGFFSFGGVKADPDHGKTDLTGTALARYSILMADDADFLKVKEIQEMGLASMTRAQGEGASLAGPGGTTSAGGNGAFTSDTGLNRALGSFVSMPIGDALGSPLEFQNVRYNDEQRLINDMEDPKAGSNFGLRPGQWTDDASMGACIADSLLMRNGFDGYDLKNRFVSWWQFGYNNATRLASKPGHSVGLGGNISMSFHGFQTSGEVITTAGDKNTCGNGSLMRNGAVACYYHDDLENGLRVARAQSYLTHQGTESAELCAALTFLVHYAINNPNAGKQEILDSIGTKFVTDCPSVQCLVRGEQEPGGNPDRNWQWKNDQHHYAPGRAKSQPGYVGSYAMDALAMALHCVHKTDTYRDALLMAANRCGDADTVCDITGQVAGAVYGYSAIPASWLKCLNQWDGNEFTVKGFKMFYKFPARYPAVVATAGGGAPLLATTADADEGHQTDSENN